MANLAGLSNAHAILLATHLCASGNVASLPQLQAQFPKSLPLERLLRIILTFLPESIEPEHYTSVLQELADGIQSPSFDGNIDISSVKDLSEAVARKRVRKLHLLPLKYPDDEDEDSQDPLTQFLIHRAHLIDSETALQPLILGLLLPFYERSPTIRTWLISSLLPLLRLNYEYYPSQEEMLTVDALESMDDNTAINVLLSMTAPHKDRLDLVKNLRGLVGPWIYGSKRSKRRKLNDAARRNSISLPQDENRPQKTDQSSWQNVLEWLLARSLIDHESVVSAFANWDGPEDVDLGGYANGNEQLQPDGGTDATNLRIRYGQIGLAVVYATSDSGKAALDGSIQILTRVAKLLDLEGSLTFPADSLKLPSLRVDVDPISSDSRALLLQNALLVPSNPLTYPSTSSISFLSAILFSLQTLDQLGNPIPCRLAANICLHSNEETQLLELQSIMTSITKQVKSDRDWGKIRRQLLWLRNWKADHSGNVQSTVPEYNGLFWRVPLDTVETEVLKALLAAREYQLAVDIYVKSKPTPLNPGQVETAVQDAIFIAYDNASNGNRTRGGMKRAYDILQAFQPHFPDSVSLKQIQALISATHALSFYSLTLQHGVPFQPVSIRVHPDPLSLIEKALYQNRKSYTKLDDLLFIGRNLVLAGLPVYSSSLSSNGDSHHHHHHEHPPPPEEDNDAMITAERRIISLTVSSALSSDDFGTAYSYILTRLTPPSLLPSSSNHTTSSVKKDDISWRAVYNAGRYRPPSSTTANSTLESQITHLSQRMELLSLALVLVPSPDPLPEILGAWRRCDEEMSVLRARESEEEHIWDAKGDALSSTSNVVPGGFGPTDSERDAIETEQQRAKRARATRSESYSRRSGRNVVEGEGGEEEEAPMGLFEVARGAAMALRKNAFPLHGHIHTHSAGGKGHRSRDLSVDSHSHTHSRSSSEVPVGDDSHQQGGEGRLRKRDMVSNMVTGGLVTGLGWVLGAQPVNQQNQNQGQGQREQR